MTRITAAPVTVRTTNDGAGHPCGVALGMGVTPWLALADLTRRAQAMLDELAAQACAAAPEDTAAPENTDSAQPGPGQDADASPALVIGEVVGVLFGAGNMESGLPGWCAYGTLRRLDAEPASPESVSRGSANPEPGPDSSGDRPGRAAPTGTPSSIPDGGPAAPGAR
jgi:hypothetical protein